ncbi:type IV pilin protein, partial [Alistipes indistinctus]
MKRIVSRRLPAFSLPELLVVLVIIGILVLIALPNLMPLIS